jgi:DNA-binding beta-propeller fold protein YncE
MVGTRMSLRVIAGSLLLISLFATPVIAAPGDLERSHPLTVRKFVADPFRNVVYASVSGNNSVAAIDMGSLDVTHTQFVGSGPAGMALSRDGSRLYVALSGASHLAVLALPSFEVLDPIPLPTPCADIEVAHDDTIFAAPSDRNTRTIYRIDPETHVATEPLPDFCRVCYLTLLEMSPDGRTLFAANQGLSPGTVAKYDVSTDDVALIWYNGHGDLGSNGQDLWLTPGGEHVYYAVGGGNRVAFGYDIAQINADTMGINGAIGTGAYPREVITSPDASVIYAVHTRGHIDVWDADTFLKIDEYTTSGEAYELAIDHTGNHLLAAFSSGLQIFEAEGNEIVIDDDADGVNDLIDNCLDLYNPRQDDTDGDSLGDLCDPYPDNADHEVAACEAERDEALGDLMICEVEATILELDLASSEAALGTCQSRADSLQLDLDGALATAARLQLRVSELESALANQCIPDEDGDGIPDDKDRCPGTSESPYFLNAVGCSLWQRVPHRSNPGRPLSSDEPS